MPDTHSLSFQSAVLFSGQLSSARKTCRQFYDGFQEFRDVLSHASEVLGYDVYRAVQSEVNQDVRNKNIQPLIFSVGYASYKTLTSKTGIIPVLGAGHSLGEITALACSGALNFEEALRFTKARGDLMLKDFGFPGGTMLAVSADRNVIGWLEQECQLLQYQDKMVSISNYNSDNQVVLSGDKADLEYLQSSVDCFDTQTTFLNVSGACHSPCMDAVCEILMHDVKTMPIGQMDYPVISNYDGKPFCDTEDIRNQLAMQVAKPVRWHSCLNYLNQFGIDVAFEVGTDQFSSEMFCRKDMYFEILPVSTVDDINKAIETHKKIRFNPDDVPFQKAASFLAACLRAVVCTKNRNVDVDQKQYEENVAVPYTQIEKIWEEAQRQASPITLKLLLQAYQKMKSILYFKCVPIKEQKRICQDIFKVAGLFSFYNDLL